MQPSRHRHVSLSCRHAFAYQCQYSVRSSVNRWQYWPNIIAYNIRLDSICDGRTEGAPCIAKTRYAYYVLRKMSLWSLSTEAKLIAGRKRHGTVFQAAGPTYEKARLLNALRSLDRHTVDWNHVTTTTILTVIPTVHLRLLSLMNVLHIDVYAKDRNRSGRLQWTVKSTADLILIAYASPGRLLQRLAASPLPRRQQNSLCRWHKHRLIS